MGRINAVNQLTKESLPNGTVESYTYDGFGNRTSDGKFTYTWDTGDRLINITKKDESNPFTTYTYDDDTRRLSKTVNGVTTNYHYDGDSIDVLYETDDDGKVIRQYVYSDSGVRLAMKMNGKTLYYHYNAHGDVVALTDEASKVVAEYAYDAWGNVLKSEATTAEAKTSPYAYAGYTYDKEIGQYYLMARYYDPEQGVFTAIDPHSGDEENPQTMNGYNYVNNNPTMFVDLNGEFAVGIVVQILKWGSRYIIKGGKWVFKKGKKFYKKVTLPKPKYTKRQLQKKWKNAGDFGVKANYSAKNAHLFESALKKHIKGATEILDTVYRGRKKVTVYIKSGKGVIVDKKGNFISGWKMTAAQLKNFRKNGTRIN